MVRPAAKTKARSGSLSRPELFETPLEPEPEPAAEETSAPERAPQERLVKWPHPLLAVRRLAVYAVLTEPDYAMPQWCLKQAVDHLKPEQYQRLAGVLLELLNEIPTPPRGEVPYEQRAEEPIPW